jgi:hypothetical protein
MLYDLNMDLFKINGHKAITTALLPIIYCPS